jgi:hypothetical protein
MSVRTPLLIILALFCFFGLLVVGSAVFGQWLADEDNKPPVVSVEPQPTTPPTTMTTVSTSDYAEPRVTLPPEN